MKYCSSAEMPWLTHLFSPDCLVHRPQPNRPIVIAKHSFQGNGKWSSSSNINSVHRGPYLVVVGVVFLGGLDHEEVAQPPARGELPGLRHGDEERAHAVLLGVLLVPAETDTSGEMRTEKRIELKQVFFSLSHRSDTFTKKRQTLCES